MISDMIREMIRDMIRNVHESSRKANLFLYAFFWVIPRRLNFICRRFGTLYSIFIDK